MGKKFRNNEKSILTVTCSGLFCIDTKREEYINFRNKQFILDLFP